MDSVTVSAQGQKVDHKVTPKYWPPGDSHGECQNMIPGLSDWSHAAGIIAWGRSGCDSVNLTNQLDHMGSQPSKPSVASFTKEVNPAIS